MWPNGGQGHLNESRLKEYQRQQERLKAMASSADRGKPMSADIMIENLLKQTFHKQPYPQTNAEQSVKSNSDLPVWLQCESSLAPVFYKDLWLLVQATLDIADTQKVSQLLLTSGLHTDVLGYIWNLANKAVPGQLNKQEFYIVLALVGLAQTGCTFNNLTVLNLIPSAPIPVLQTKLFDKTVVLNSNVKNSDLQSFQSLNKVCDTTGIHKNSFDVSGVTPGNALQGSQLPELNTCEPSSSLFDYKITPGRKKDSEDAAFFYGNQKEQVGKELLDISPVSLKNFPCIGSSPTAGLEDDFTDFQSMPAKKCEKVLSNSDPIPSNLIDDFTDFQSADLQFTDPLETVVITQKRDIPRIPLPKNFTGKLANLKSNILKISPESERKLKTLSQAESLSSLPESKISSNNEVSTVPAIPAISGSRGIGSRLANHSLGSKSEKFKHHHKHHKVKSLTNVDDILATSKSLSSANVDEIFPRCYKNLSGSKTFLLKETKIRSNDFQDTSTTPKREDMNIIDNPISVALNNTRTIEIPMLGTFNETILPAQGAATQIPGIELLSVEEDKYRALREVDLEMNEKSSTKISKAVDDFGDFLSAEAPGETASVETENWSDWKFTSDVVTSAQETVPEVLLESAKTIEKQIDSSITRFPGCLENNTFDKMSSTKFPAQTEIQPQMKVDFLPGITETSSNFPESLQFSGISSNTSKDVSSTPIFFSSDLLNLGLGSSTNNNQGTRDFPTPPPLTLIDEKENTGDIDFKPYLETENENDKINWFQNTGKQGSGDFANENVFGDFLTCAVKPAVRNETSRRSSVSSLDFKISPTEESEQEIIWRKCLESCCNILQEASEIFIVSSKYVLEEVFSTQEAVDYMNNLYLVYNISRRIVQNCREVPSIQEDIEKIWRKLDGYCFEFDVKLKEEEDYSGVSGNQCAICLAAAKGDSISQGHYYFHLTCANLWVNCVEVTLPYSL